MIREIQLGLGQYRRKLAHNMVVAKKRLCNVHFLTQSDVGFPIVHFAVPNVGSLFPFPKGRSQCDMHVRPFSFWGILGKMPMRGQPRQTTQGYDQCRQNIFRLSPFWALPSRLVVTAIWSAGLLVPLRALSQPKSWVPTRLSGLLSAGPLVRCATMRAWLAAAKTTHTSQQTQTGRGMTPCPVFCV